MAVKGRFPVGAGVEAYQDEARPTVSKTPASLNISEALGNLATGIEEYQEISLKVDKIKEKRVTDRANEELEARIFTEIAMPLEKDPTSMDNETIAENVNKISEEVGSTVPEAYRPEYMSGIQPTMVMSAGQLILGKDKKIIIDQKKSLITSVSTADTKEEINDDIALAVEFNLFGEGQLSQIKEMGYEQVEKKQLKWLDESLGTANTEADIDMELEKAIDSKLITKNQAKIAKDANMNGVINKQVSYNLDQASDDIENPSSYLYKMIPAKDRASWRNEIGSRITARTNSSKFAYDVDVFSNTLEIQAISDAPTMPYIQAVDLINSSQLPEQSKKYLVKRLNFNNPVESTDIKNLRLQIDGAIKGLTFDSEKPLEFSYKVSGIQKAIQQLLIDEKIDKTSADKFMLLTAMEMNKHKADVIKAYKGETSPNPFSSDIWQPANFDTRQIIKEAEQNADIQSALNGANLAPELKNDIILEYDMWITEKDKDGIKYNVELPYEKQKEKWEEIIKSHVTKGKVAEQKKFNKAINNKGVAEIKKKKVVGKDLVTSINKAFPDETPQTMEEINAWIDSEVKSKGQSRETVVQGLYRKYGVEEPVTTPPSKARIDKAKKKLKGSEDVELPKPEVATDILMKDIVNWGGGMGI